MNAPATILLSALPWVAGWAVHARILHGRLNTARRDPLTGLRTRDGFTRRATALLAATAARLAHAVGRAGVAGRLGGDEFAAVLIDPHGTAADRFAVLARVLARPERFTIDPTQA